ncbi:MAG: tetrahydromethanopterin S-methyltransferase subunit A [Chloroflexi bacterium]|nr:tetrahydromethanopterin S-methyltransferase subunit A [Chloroflexota bacterium]
MADDAVEVMFYAPLRETMEKIVAEENCEIVQLEGNAETLKATIKKKAPAAEMLKAPPVADYPTEAGCFLRGNDYSPVAVVVLLHNAPYAALAPKVEDVRPEIQNLVKVAIETGAALSGTLQTENIGIEKIVCNVVGNPNIRYLVLCGEEVAGHQPGGAVKALFVNGINEKRTIIGSQALTPYLFNISLEAIERFRKQVTLVDLMGEMDPQVVLKAVWSCYQEQPTPFKGYRLHDPGAYSETGIATRLAGRVAHPEAVEAWELDDIVKRIEAEQREAPVTERAEKPAVDPGLLSSLRKRLMRVSEELADIARLLPEEAKAGVAPITEVEEGEEVKAAVEESPTVLFFMNQLRGFHSVLAGLEACNRDICHGGKTLPLSVGRTIKRLGKLKADLQEATLSVEDKNNLMARIELYLQRGEALPQEAGP